MDPLLVVGENTDSAEDVCSHLRAIGYQVDVRLPADASAVAEIHRYSALILDTCTTGQSRFGVCWRYRHTLRFSAPIIVISDSAALNLKLAAFNDGADDYLVKPVYPAEIELRIRNRLMRRRYSERFCTLRIDDLVLETATHRVARAGTPLRVAPLEYRLLRLLMLASPRFVSPAEMERELWGGAPPPTGSLRNHLYRLRKKLHSGGQKPMLQTLPSSGSRLVG